MVPVYKDIRFSVELLIIQVWPSTAQGSTGIASWEKCLEARSCWWCLKPKSRCPGSPVEIAPPEWLPEYERPPGQPRRWRAVAGRCGSTVRSPRIPGAAVLSNRYEE